MSRAAGLVAAAALAVSATAVGVAGTPAEPPGSPERTATAVATSQAALSCLASLPSASIGTTLFAVAPAVTGRENEGPGQLVVSTLDGGRHITGPTSPGVPMEKPLNRALAPSVLVLGTGNASPGLTAAQLSTSRGKQASGISAVWCERAAEEWWFSGVDTSTGAASRLTLVNPTTSLAVVDVSFYGPAGPGESAGKRGLAIAPHTRVSVDLAGFVPGLESVTTHVESTTGRVVAGLHTNLVDGVSPRGTEWVAPTQAPALDVLVNAGFAGKTEQQLHITNPSEQEALVSVQVVDASGPFTPSTLKTLRVPPGGVVVRKLTEVTGDAATAILLTSSVPVLGTVVDTSRATSDFAVSVVSQALTDPAIVPVLPDTDLSLAFASTDRVGGKVAIESFDDGGRSLTRENLNLRGLTTTTWKPASPNGNEPQAAYLVVTVAVDGRTQATAHYQSPAGISSLPVRSGVYTVIRPDVRPSG